MTVFNLYAYVKNNPIMWIDPSGYAFDNNIDNYLKRIISDIGLIQDPSKVWDGLKGAIQAGTFTKPQIDELYSKVVDYGLADRYESKMLEVKFGVYYENMFGNKFKYDFNNPHAHPILSKVGPKDKEIRKLVQEAQDVLRKHKIDPILGLENLTWASNGGGQHKNEKIKAIANRIIDADKNINLNIDVKQQRNQMVRILNDEGREARKLGRVHPGKNIIK